MDSKNENNATVNISAENVTQEKGVAPRLVTRYLPASGFPFYKAKCLAFREPINSHTHVDLRALFFHYNSVQY